MVRRDGGFAGAAKGDAPFNVRPRRWGDIEPDWRGLADRIRATLHTDDDPINWPLDRFDGAIRTVNAIHAAAAGEGGDKADVERKAEAAEDRKQYGENGPWWNER